MPDEPPKPREKHGDAAASPSAGSGAASSSPTRNIIGLVAWMGLSFGAAAVGGLA
jgi:hypothetical protein